MHLKIKTTNQSLEETYSNHSNYHEGDSGLDLFVVEDINIEANACSKVIDLQISCQAFAYKSKDRNVSYYLYPRSYMGSKTPLRLSNSVGIIDAGYRGNIMAIVDNVSDKDYVVTKGTRLFQLCSPDLSPITYEMTDNLSDTSRGLGGLGSTG